MFKSLLIIIFVALILWAARSFTMRLKNRPANGQNKPANNNMLQCAQCKTYIPSEDAIIKGDKSFCSSQHLEDWNKSA
jgi:ribosomal protein S26